MRKKYFFFDIDGTLTSAKIRGFVAETTKQAIKQLEENGHFVAIATGRPYYFAKEFANELQIHNLVCNGGNDLYRNGKCIFHCGYNIDKAKRAIQECLANGFGLCVSYDDSIKRITHNHVFQEKVGSVFRGEIEVNDKFDYRTLTNIERVYIAIRKEEEYKMAIFKEEIPARYQPTYVILEPDDKYLGISRLMKMMEAKEQDVVVFGDGTNDIKMFQKAAFKIAMGNAVPILKDLADYVTKESDDEGIPYALQHFGWI